MYSKGKEIIKEEFDHSTKVETNYPAVMVSSTGELCRVGDGWYEEWHLDRPQPVAGTMAMQVVLQAKCFGGAANAPYTVNYGRAKRPAAEFAWIDGVFAATIPFDQVWPNHLLRLSLRHPDWAELAQYLDGLRAEMYGDFQDYLGTLTSVPSNKPAKSIDRQCRFCGSPDCWGSCQE